MTERPHLLIVEDEDSIRAPLVRYLERESFRVTAVADAAQAREALATAALDLAILDLMLPGEDGLSLARFIRATSPLPILMLTARAEDIDKIVGLEMGADDYLTKPFNPRELVARLRAILRRGAGLLVGAGDAPDYAFDRWVLRTGPRALVGLDGEEVTLTAGEYALLLALVERPGRTLSRDQLLDLTQGREAGVFDRAVDNAVSRLRRKIEVDPATPALIKTVHAAGYVLAAEVRRL